MSALRQTLVDPIQPYEEPYTKASTYPECRREELRASTMRDTMSLFSLGNINCDITAIPGHSARFMVEIMSTGHLIAETLSSDVAQEILFLAWATNGDFSARKTVPGP